MLNWQSCADLLCCLGNPLHSTAVEEDLNVLEEAQMDGKNIPKATKGRVKAK